MVVTDAWKAYTHGVSDKPESKHPILTFVDCLIWDIANSDFDEKESKSSVDISPLKKVKQQKIEVVSPEQSDHQHHVQVKHDSSGKRTKRLSCKICSLQSAYKCQQCGYTLCQDYSKNKKTQEL